MSSFRYLAIATIPRFSNFDSVNAFTIIYRKLWHLSLADLTMKAHLQPLNYRFNVTYRRPYTLWFLFTFRLALYSKIFQVHFSEDRLHHQFLDLIFKKSYKLCFVETNLKVPSIGITIQITHFIILLFHL